MAFVLMAALMNLVYLQMYSTLSVFLRDVHEVPTQGYGFMMSANALLVVLMQFWVTRRVRPYPPMIMMAAGTALYMVGFSAYGFVSTYPAFVAAMLVITVGEMIVIPVSQALVARFAPAEIRGRYIAIAGLSWGIPSAIGPLAAGVILDHYNPNLVWYAAGLLSFAAVLGFLLLHPALPRPVGRNDGGRRTLRHVRLRADATPREPAPGTAVFAMASRSDRELRVDPTQRYPSMSGVA